MPDLNKIPTADPIYLTDGISLSANLLASTPTGTETGLITRNIPSGTQTVAGTVTAVGAATSGSAVTGNPLLIGASDGTNVQTLRVNPVNNGIETLLMQNNENLRQTYSILLSNFPVATASTDVFVVVGSATKTVRVTHIEFSMTTTTAAVIPVQIVKRSTANTGGTIGVAAITPHDSSNATATGTNIAYAAPAATLGTIVGTGIRSAKYFSQTAATGNLEQLVWDFGGANDQPIVLRGVAQSAAINLSGTAMTGATISCSITWTEDNS